MGVSDFVRYFYPAARTWLEGRNPYQLPGVYNPPWAWWLLGPLAAWPPEVAWWLWLLLSVFLLLGALLLIRRPSGWSLLALLLAPATLIHLAMGQWAIWSLMGVVLLQSRRAAVQGAGLLLLSLKPHLGWPFLLLTGPRAWPVPLAALLFSLLLRPRWPLDFAHSLRAEPPVGYEGLLVARSLSLGAPLLVGLAVVLTGVVLWVIGHCRPARRWQLALLCCLVPFFSPYHRLYDNLLLFYPLLLLTERHPQAWLVIGALLWLPLLLIVYPWAVFVDWLAPLVLLMLLVRRLAQARRTAVASLVAAGARGQTG